MRLVLQTHYCGSFDDASDLTHVLVDIDPRYQLDRRAKLSEVLATPEIYSVTFFDFTPFPLSCDFSGEAPEWFDEAEEILMIPDLLIPPAADFRIEAPTIRYMPDGIMWHFYEKHCGDSYETATISWDFIQKAAKQGKRAKIPR